MNSPRIQDHAVIGDLNTVALVALDGTIDFLCMPRLDGPSVFARLLDEDGGSFAIEPDLESPRYLQMYLPDTNVVLTRMLDGERICEITDFMVVGKTAEDPVIVRIVRSLRGTVRFRMRCSPHFDYARADHAIAREADAIDFHPANGQPSLRLISSVELAIDGFAATADFSLANGESRAFVLGVPRENEPPIERGAVDEYVNGVRDAAVDYWLTWSKKSSYRGRWQGVVMRSALTLKLMVSKEHGSIAAAATFGLPESPGGTRNWDYRYSWIRDASFAAYAFIRLGYLEESLAFMSWINQTLAKLDPSQPLPPLHRLDGGASLEEFELPHLTGFGGAKPVRVGNGAAGQLQLDVYGALMDTVYLTSKYGDAMSYDSWHAVARYVEWICENWRTPDEGIWEARNGREQYLHSRIMTWVAVDRALRLAEKRSLPAPTVRWNEVRSAIHDSIMTDFWNDDLKAFVRTKGSEEVDASALMMPLVRVIGSHDPRWRSTQARIEDQLVDDALVYRYRTGSGIDGIDDVEGAFATCTFWLVECLARQGQVRRAEAIFEKALGFGNHLGLFAEEFGPDGTQYGNFPQTLTHLALISAATALDRARDPEPTTWAN